MPRLRLLPESALIRTSPVDHAGWTFMPLVGPIVRLRYRMIVSLMGHRRFGRLLEVGYGSGIFLPELALRAGELHGADIHAHGPKIQRILADRGCPASLVRAGAERLPYEDGFFDAAVALSALEFVSDLTAACRELRRVLRPGGAFFVVTPGCSPLLDLGLHLLTGASAADDFGGRRDGILPALARNFEVAARRTAPPFVGSFFRAYTALELRAPALGPPRARTALANAPTMP